MFGQPLSNNTISLAELAAHNAFYKLGPVWMRSLVMTYRVEVPAQASLCTLLSAAIRRFLPKTSEDELLNILAKRADLGGGATDDDLLWGDAAIAELCEEGDLEEVQKDKVKENDQKQVSERFKSEVKALKEKVFAKRSGAAPSKKGRGRAAVGERLPAPPLKHEVLPKDPCRPILVFRLFRQCSIFATNRILVFSRICLTCVPPRLSASR